MGLRNPRKKERKEYLSHNFSDSDSSVGSILGACLDGFNGDAWMSDVEGAHDDIQVGEVTGVNDPGNIPWRTTAWRAGGVDVGSVKAAKRASESRKQPASKLSAQTTTFEPQGVEIGENGDGDGAARGGVAGEGRGADGGGVTLTPQENKRLRRLQLNKAWKASQKASPSHQGSNPKQPGGTRHKKRTQK